jgi:hypothetical protein
VRISPIQEHHRTNWSGAGASGGRSELSPTRAAPPPVQILIKGVRAILKRRFVGYGCRHRKMLGQLARNSYPEEGKRWLMGH